MGSLISSKKKDKNNFSPESPYSEKVLDKTQTLVKNETLPTAKQKEAANANANAKAKEAKEAKQLEAAKATTNAKQQEVAIVVKNTENTPEDPDEIFKLIQEFESKFFNKFFIKVKKGKSSKNQAKNETKPDHIFKFLKVLLLYKKLFPTNKTEDIDYFIKKYSTLCPKDGNTKCGLTKEKTTLGVTINTYNNQSEKIKKLSENIKNQTSKNFIGMLDKIIPRSNANKKITNENMNKIESKIQIFVKKADQIKYFGSGTNDEILKKYLDFIKFLLLFKKIMKNKNKYSFYDGTIDRLYKKYLKSCSLNELINENKIKRLEKCKSSETQNNKGNWNYEISSSNTELLQLLEDGWKNDKDFGDLKNKFNEMLNEYYGIFNVEEKIFI
jgi:hypothetical protein